jgi:hypothetical protein
MAYRAFRDRSEPLVHNRLLLMREVLDGEPRFSFLELIREYARERLDEGGVR